MDQLLILSIYSIARALGLLGFNRISLEQCGEHSGVLPKTLSKKD